MDVDRNQILEFLSRRRDGGATLQDILHSMQLEPHQRKRLKRLLRDLSRDGEVRRSEAGRFVLSRGAGGSGTGGGQQRPAGGQQRPAGGQQRPAGGQQRPAGGGGGGTKPTFGGNRPYAAPRGGMTPVRGGADIARPEDFDQPQQQPPARPVQPPARPNLPQRGGPQPHPNRGGDRDRQRARDQRSGGGGDSQRDPQRGGGGRTDFKQPHQRGGRDQRPSSGGPRGPQDGRRPGGRHDGRFDGNGGAGRPQAPQHAPGEAPDIVIGRFTRNPEGYGFVAPQDRKGTDVFIPPDAVGSALHGDIVDARVTNEEANGRRAGRIVGVRERSRASIPGRLETKGKNLLIIPDDKRMSGEIWVSPKDTMGAREGDLVLAEITTPQARDFWAKGKVTKVLGDREDPGIDSDLVIGEFGIQVEFSAATLAEAAAIPERIPEEERRRRRDLTHVPFVTIDGVNAKDFDDAVAVERLSNGRTRLYVAIADVAFYVRPGTALNEDAAARATSVYLPDRVVPMLPERLSNDLCSLRPNEDRLALCAAMDIDNSGVVREYGIDRVVFRSKQRMTYEDVHGIVIDKTPHLLDKYRDHLADFELMHSLAMKLRGKRFSHGSIDFDLPEPTVVVDLTGATTDIIRSPRYVSHKIVEEFMLLANVTVARHFAGMGVPLVYRVHDAPDPERLAAFNEVLGPYGVTLTEEDLESPAAVGRVLSRFADKPQERIVNSLMLRAMRQASYSIHNLGHFGLAFPHYAHFTSPIRRYPDLLVHRACHAMLDGRSELTRYARMAEEEDSLEEEARHSSRQERVAMDAERAIIALKKVRFMRDKVGEVYAGHVTGVAKFGLFVELDEVFVEGLVRMDAIGKDDQYEFDEKAMRIRGRRSGRAFRLGDPVTVEVVNVSLERRAIDFKIVRKAEPS